MTDPEETGAISNGYGSSIIGVDTTSVIEGCRGSAKTAAYMALNFGIDIYEGHHG